MLQQTRLHPQHMWAYVSFVETQKLCPKTGCGARPIGKNLRGQSTRALASGRTATISTHHDAPPHIYRCPEPASVWLKWCSYARAPFNIRARARAHWQLRIYVFGRASQTASQTTANKIHFHKLYTHLSRFDYECAYVLPYDYIRLCDHYIIIFKWMIT